MIKLRKSRPEGINASSMADIAFLMLVFFMVTTSIREEKGLLMSLPAWNAQSKPGHINERNLFTVQLNSNDQLMVDGNPRANLTGLKSDVKEFIMNYKKDPTLSDSPSEAVISIKTDRGTSYKAFITTLDEIQGAYFEIYAERAGMSVDDFRKLDTSREDQKTVYNKACEHIPMNISVANPTNAEADTR